MPTNHLTLYVLSTRQQLSVDVTGKTVLGRASGVDDEGTLNIDLSPFMAYQLGVSRRHILFVPEGDQILAFDLSSRNGSRINGELMSARKGYPIEDSDELMLGSLEIRVYMTSEVPYANMQTRQLPTLEDALERNPPMPAPRPDIRETLTGTRPLSLELMKALDEAEQVDNNSRV
jgi:pSer/pThr/pTyr-binding forkhead associated (FHA) protein